MVWGCRLWVLVAKILVLDNGATNVKDAYLECQQAVASSSPSGHNSGMINKIVHISYG